MATILVAMQDLEIQEMILVVPLKILVEIVEVPQAEKILAVKIIRSVEYFKSLYRLGI